MTEIRFSKERISIHNIGKQRFWIGIVVGVLTSISISLVFNYSREVLRFITSVSGDLLILEEQELQFFNYFFPFLATVLGLSITIWLWMGNNAHNRRKDRILKQLSRTNALLIFWLILLVITRFGSIIIIIMYGVDGYESQLNLYDEYWLLFVLMPIVVFIQNWFIVRLVYRTGHWIILSFIICVILSFSLLATTTVEQEAINNAYFLRFEKDYQYIDKEVLEAKSKYGINFTVQTIDILKKFHSESSVDQVSSIKIAFAKNNRISLDTIILQKIVIHNYKHRKESRYFRRQNSLENWNYALPKDILKQIGYFNITSNETKELFKVLKEQIDLVNTPEIKWEEYKNYTETERRKSKGAKYNIPYILISQLNSVRDSLIKNERYSELNKILPEIKK